LIRRLGDRSPRANTVPYRHLRVGDAALAHHEDQVRVLLPDGQRVSIPRLKGVSHIRNGLAIFRIKSRVELISIDRLHVHIAGLAEQGGDVGIFLLTLRGTWEKQEKKQQAR
jgi:hypothetical protein